MKKRIALLCALGLTAAACGSTTTKTVTATKTANPTTMPTATTTTGTTASPGTVTGTPQPFPKTLEARYLQGCTKGKKGQAAFCRCTLTSIERRVDVGTFIASAGAIESGHRPDWFNAAIVDCVKLIP